jgi:hypothetical protein
MIITMSNMDSTVNLVIVFTIFTIIVLVWPRWMYFTKKLFLEKIYYKVTPSLTYFQTKAIFENIFYSIFGLIAVLLISNFFEIPILQIFLLKENNNDIFGLIVKIFLDLGLLTLVNSAAIFVCTGLILPSITNSKKSRKLDFGNSWMETYMKLNPLRLVFAISFLSILAEELFFRIVINSVLFQSFMFIDIPSGLFIVLIVTISTTFFIIQQSIMLKNRTQIITIGISSFWIGLINSTAFMLGASFYSILLSHYIFVISIIISLRLGKQESSKFTKFH